MTDSNTKKILFYFDVKTDNTVICQYFYRTVIPTATVRTDINWRGNSLIYRLCFEQLQFEECVCVTERGVGCKLCGGDRTVSKHVAV